MFLAVKAGVWSVYATIFKQRLRYYNQRIKGLEKLYVFRKSRRSLGKPYLQSFA
jgi:hypothetical protein